MGFRTLMSQNAREGAGPRPRAEFQAFTPSSAFPMRNNSWNLPSILSSAQWFVLSNSFGVYLFAPAAPIEAFLLAFKESIACPSVPHQKVFLPTKPGWLPHLDERCSVSDSLRVFK